jgi:hypothetical protein
MFLFCLITIFSISSIQILDSQLSYLNYNSRHFFKTEPIDLARYLQAVQVQIAYGAEPLTGLKV